MLSLFGRRVGEEIRSLRPAAWRASTPHPLLSEALGTWAISRSPIHDHLGTIFAESVAANPRLIVELGTDRAISTRALLAAAALTEAHVLSIDIADCSKVDIPARFRVRWTFAQSDDVTYAAEPFAAFCAGRGLPPEAEVILIDTSHEYEHTVHELEAWLPRLGPRGVVMLHDTNMGRGWYRGLDGAVRLGFDNHRGVVRALEGRVGRNYHEGAYFTDVAGGFVVQHVPWSSGFTVLRRCPGLADA